MGTVFLGLPSLQGKSQFIHVWLSPLIIQDALKSDFSLGLEISLLIFSVMSFLLMSLITYRFCSGHLNNLKNTPFIRYLNNSFKESFLLDLIILKTVSNGLRDLSYGLKAFIDENLVEKLGVVLERSVFAAGKSSKFLQAGGVQTYISIFVFGVAFILMGVLFL